MSTGLPFSTGVRAAGNAVLPAARRRTRRAARGGDTGDLAQITQTGRRRSTRAASLHKRDQWIDLLYPHVLPSVGGARASRELRARAIVSAALACLHVAVDAWTESAGKEGLDVLLDTAFEAVPG